MNQSIRIRRLRCALCRRGLLGEYNVYDVPDEGAPVLYSAVSGYFYSKGTRHSAEILEIAGNIGEQSAYTCRLLVFANADGQSGCKIGDLIDIGGSVYKVAFMREVYCICWLLDLEDYPYRIAY